MVKPYSPRRGTTVPPPSRAEYRIGLLDLTNLWNPDDDQYKVICRMVHCTKAALHIGYIQMLISFAFSIFFGYYYMMAVTGNLSADHWINQYKARYISQLLFAISVQLILVVVMLHGIRSERRSLLLPYIGYAAVTILAGCAQLGSDFLSIDRNQSAEAKAYNSSQFIGHLLGTLIHAWCLSVIWKAYTYIGDKKVAQKVTQQLSQTQAAFHYPDQLLSCVMPQPPPYVDAIHANRVIPQAPEPEKEPLNVV